MTLKIHEGNVTHDKSMAHLRSQDILNQSCMLWRGGRCLVQPKKPFHLLQLSGASFKQSLLCTTETLLHLMGQMMKLPILSSENLPLYIIRSTNIKVSVPNCCQEPATQSIPTGLQGTSQTTSQSLSLNQIPDLSEEQFTRFSKGPN